MNKKQIEIQSCSPNLIRPLRARILRPGQPMAASHYPGEESEESLHLCAMIGDEVVGCASWMPEPASFRSAQKPYRLRGMATDNNYQGQGIGKRLVEESLKILKAKGVDFVWCNAREVAFLFYEKMNFKYHGTLFELPLIGPHKIMYLELE